MVEKKLIKPNAIVIGDPHFPVDDEARLSGLLKIFRWLRTNIDSSTPLIITGDTLDSATVVRWKLIKSIRELLGQWKEIHWLQGNHDVSFSAGSCLDAFEFDNVKGYRTPDEVEIGDLKILMLPHLLDSDKMLRDYPLIESDCDYAITHTAAPGTLYGNGEIDLPLIRARIGIIDGHIHVGRDLKLNNVMRYVLGAPQPRGYGEEVGDPRIALLFKDRIEFKEIPRFFSYSSIKYGEEIPEPGWRYNVIDAPDRLSVYERYKGFYIRDIGISVVRNQDEDQITTLKELRSQGKDSFEARAALWITESNPTKEIKEVIERLIVEIAA